MTTLVEAKKVHLHSTAKDLSRHEALSYKVRVVSDLVNNNNSTSYPTGVVFGIGDGNGVGPGLGDADALGKELERRENTL